MSRENNPQEWLRYAENDRQAAIKLLELGFYEQCTFYCQQAVEKLLKALLVLQTGRRPVHTHDLSALLEKITGIESSEEIARAISDIDGYYVGSRYPLDTVDPGFIIKPLAEKAVQRTGEVFQWFSARVNFNSE
jgi:HEPN domain-containing protein